MFIQTEATADSESLRFLPGRPVLPQGRLDMGDRAAAAASPLAVRLFAVSGVCAVSLLPDAIVVTKKGGDWKHVKPAVLSAIMDHFVSGAPVLRETPDAAGKPPQAADPLADKIRDALHQVIDPELGYNIVDLGLIYDVAIHDGDALVTMTTTTPGCPATTYLVEGARECTSGVEGVTSAEIRLTHDPRWSPALMSDSAKAHFGIE